MEFKRFRELLVTRNHFVTAPRLRLFQLLQKRPALTLKQLIELVPEHDQVTVYRNVDLFEKLGIITRIRLGWQTKIELSDSFQHHHHHFTCLRCNTVIDIPEDAHLENRITQLSAVAGLLPTDHQLEIRGLCARCSMPDTAAAVS